MTDRAAELFARPMPFQVRWVQGDGRYQAITTFSREAADKSFDTLVDAGLGPVMWLGGMVVRDLVPGEIAAS